MAAVEGLAPLVIVGGKGSSLTSASVFAVSNGLAQVQIDSSALERLSDRGQLPQAKFRFSLPDYLTLEETRASFLFLLNKLVLSGANGGIRPYLPELIVDSLNKSSFSQLLEEDSKDVTALELVALEKSLFSLYGLCALLDHQSSTLLTIADATAALSCEASGANTSVFSNLDSGDASSVNKDEVGVANDLKIFLNGSKLLGKHQYDVVSEIPEVHGTFRTIIRFVHSMIRVELNSPVFKGGKAMVAAFSPLAQSLLHLGMGSWNRAKINIDVMANADFKLTLTHLFEKDCPEIDSLRNSLVLSSKAGLEEDYVKFFHELGTLLQMVKTTVSWETTTAFLVLEGNELTQKSPSAGTDVNGGKVKAEKRGDKKKKVLGKGTTALVQFLKESILDVVDETASPLLVLEKLVKSLISLFDPKDSGFYSVLKKLKEIVECNETRRLPKLPKGTRDFAKEQMAIREKAFSVIVDVFKRHGATSLDTPAFELRETLMGKYGEDSKLVYDLADQGGELCSLRYDLTVPFARYVAMNGITSFKRYQIAKVYRRDNPSKGRYREFYQCDFDIAGQYETMGPDFEVIKVMTELLDDLNIGEYEIKLNHRKLLDGMLDICGVPQGKFRTICSSIDKLDKQTFLQIKKEMVEEKGLTDETADMIGTFVKERGSPLELLSKLKQESSKFMEHEGSRVALNELEILFKALDKSKCINKVVFDLSLARGLDYYTGVIFEAVFKGETQVGSIAAGGRYDNLIGMFGNKQVPAVGISLGIERVFTIMEQLQKDQNQTTRATETQVLVSIIGDDLSLAAEITSELWGARIKAEYLVNKRVTKHFDKAKDSKIPWMVIVGEREITEGVVKLKDIEAAKEDVIPRSKLVEELSKRLNIV
ncbi:histidine--tRNA ligase, cytoplasmic-like [Impatiens glandulifera]|uniref:histidine--tRNA ligase, cytoplasmic-like n=1 Tax=Impatiens glandulifera TaxID=253017 RepID=UPI001FB1744F|nr:histidine--tRNA ligase, cytoplasmic-like [Impatiens glandulifera]